MGLDSPFGTMIVDARSLVGATVGGARIRLEGTLGTPMKEAEISVFRGTVRSVRNTNCTGPDPVWVADVQLPCEHLRSVNLTEARGLRAERSTLAEGRIVSGGELEAHARRRAGSNEDFGRLHGRDATGIPSSVRIASRLARLPPAERNTFAEYRRDFQAILTGEGGVAFLQRTETDLVPRPLHQIFDEQYRPLVEETQRMLYATEGRHGFNRWLVDLATEIALDLRDRDKLEWVSREANVVDVHANIPFAEGRLREGDTGVTIPTRRVRLDGVPRITQRDVYRQFDRRISEHRFDRNLDKVGALKTAPYAEKLAILEGTDLPTTTADFVNLTRHGILFVDAYFTDKPHGSNSHIIQWLYLADRASDGNANIFGRNVHDVFMRVLPRELTAEGPTGILLTDHVGQRAPQNPDHINNALKLIFATDGRDDTFCDRGIDGARVFHDRPPVDRHSLIGSSSAFV